MKISLNSIIKVLVSILLILQTTIHFSAFAQKESEKVDALFNEVITNRSPGCSVGIYQNQKMLYKQGYGLADLENTVPITSKTIFNIGSVSKQFTAAAIIKLQQLGKLTIEDDIRKYLPEIPEYEKIITIRHLLNHTSGLRNSTQLLLASGHDYDDVTTNENVLSLLMRQRGLNFTPGSKHYYSNSGYFLASLIVERLSGRTLKEFSKEHFFSPLNMSATTFVNSHTQLVNKRATGYRLSESNKYERFVSYSEQIGSGGVFTNVEDLMQWDNLFYSDDIEKQSLKNALYQKGKLNNGKEIDYALGLRHGNHKGIKLIQHAGEASGYRAHLVRAPKYQFSVATLCNATNLSARSLAKEVLEIYLTEYLPETQKEKEITPQKSTNSVKLVAKLDERVYQRYIGKYEYTDYPGYFVLLYIEDGTFWLSAPHLSKPSQLEAVSEHEFFSIDGETKVKFKLDDTKSYYYPTIKGYPTDKVIPHKASKKELESYVGNYHSDELNMTYDVSYKDKKLIATDFNGKSIELKFLDKERFETESWQFSDLTIQRGKQKQVTGLSMQLRGGSRIVFKKL